MTTIDIRGKCKKLGVEYDVYESASNKFFLAEERLLDYEDPYKHLPDFLTNDEVIAIVRYRNLHLRFPQYFDWDKGYIGE